MKKSLLGWMDYNKDTKEFTGNFYFKKPTTSHTHPWIVAKKVKINEILKCFGKDYLPHHPDRPDHISRCNNCTDKIDCRDRFLNTNGEGE